MVSPPRPDKNQNLLYPVFLKLTNFEILLVGGGNVALEKLNSVLSNSPDAHIHLVAPEIKQEIEDLARIHSTLKIDLRKFIPEDLHNKSLVICATDDNKLHKHIKGLTTASHQLLNVADTPELCDFYLGSIVQKGNLKIAISTNGLSPTGAKRIKESLDNALPHTLDQVLIDLNLIRNKLKGDFAYKIKRMNEVTTLMGLSHNVIRRKKWIQIFIPLLGLLISFLIGYTISKF